MVEQFGLHRATGKGVTTPGVLDDSDEDSEEANEAVCSFDASLFRAIPARCNYLASDRPDILYPVKELCREMSAPTQRSWNRLKRVGRFLKHRPRLVWKFNWQAETEVVDVHVDANWCGRTLTRQSTSGGTLARGKHLIKAWSKTHAILAKSSGESELYEVVQGACEGLGVSTLLKDLGEVTPHIRMHLDATVAKGIVERRGLSKLRHIDLDIIRLQEQEARKLLPWTRSLGRRTWPTS